MSINEQLAQALSECKTALEFAHHKSGVVQGMKCVADAINSAGLALATFRAQPAPDEQAAGQEHDNLHDTIGQAISDVLTGWYSTEDGTLGVDPFDSRNIDEIADAVIRALAAAPHPPAQRAQAEAVAVVGSNGDSFKLAAYLPPGTKLYATPQQAAGQPQRGAVEGLVPLSEEQINRLITAHEVYQYHPGAILEFVRSVEAELGIRPAGSEGQS